MPFKPQPILSFSTVHWDLNNHMRIGIEDKSLQAAFGTLLVQSMHLANFWFPKPVTPGAINTVELLFCQKLALKFLDFELLPNLTQLISEISQADSMPYSTVLIWQMGMARWMNDVFSISHYVGKKPSILVYEKDRLWHEWKNVMGEVEWNDGHEETATKYWDQIFKSVPDAALNTLWASKGPNEIVEKLVVALIAPFGR